MRGFEPLFECLEGVYEVNLCRKIYNEVEIDFGVGLEDTVSKLNFETFFIKRLPKNMQYIKLPNDPIVARFHRPQKQFIPDLGLTAAYMTCNTNLTTIVQPKPNPL